MILADAISGTSSVELGLVVAIGSLIFGAAAAIGVQRYKVVSLEKTVARLLEQVDSVFAEIRKLQHWQISRDSEAAGRRSERKRLKTDTYEVPDAVRRRHWQDSDQTGG